MGGVGCWWWGGDVIRQEVAAKVDAETRLPVCRDPHRTADVGLDTQARLPSAAVVQHRSVQRATMGIKKRKKTQRLL